MTLADRACDLECVKKAPPRHEFIGPVKIILIEPYPEDYQRKAWGSAFLTFAMLLMGFTVFTVFFFTLRFKLQFPENVHVFLCTMGYQLFLPSGILMINSLFGGASQLKPPDRKFQHVFLQVCAIGCGVTGSTVVILLGSAEDKFTVHSITGLITAGLVLFTSLIGPTVYFTNQAKAYGKFNRSAHVFFAVSGFMMGTLCFILGITKESFMNWTPIEHFHYILIVFTLIFSAAVLVSIYLRAKLQNQ